MGNNNLLVQKEVAVEDIKRLIYDVRDILKELFKI